MSEQAEREIEIVAGTIGGITQKKADTWTVAVNVEGFQNPKNLWTKDAELVESLQSKFGQAGAFVCSASYWNHPQHGQVRSLWIQGESDGMSDVGPTTSDSEPSMAPGGARSVATPAAAPKGATSGEQLSKDEWARKDSAAWKRMLIESAADALKHTIPSDPSRDDLNQFLDRVTHLTLAWHRSVLAERDDPTGETVPF